MKKYLHALKYILLISRAKGYKHFLFFF